MKRLRIPLGLMVTFLASMGCQLSTAVSTTTPAAENLSISTVSPTVATPTNAALIASPTVGEESTTAIDTPTPQPTLTPTLTPTPWPIPEATIEVEGATLPPGFSLIKFADLYRPTALTFDAAGRLFVTSFDGTVHILTDEDGNGRADTDTIFASGFTIPLGITLRPGTQDVYVSSNTQITILRDQDGDSKADEFIPFASGLPVGLHQNDNLKFGPDGMLYMGIGSTCDVCVEADARSATIMRFDPDTGDGEIYATGLRNPYDLVFHPQTGDLLATDNGRDDLGPDAPREELNHIIAGAHYGWPDCWGDFQGPGCDGTVTAVAFFEPHSSANSIDFYTGNRFPPAYQNVAYVAIFGSFLIPETTNGVARVELTPTGDSYTGQVSWFAQWPGGMPLGLIAGPDGALYVGDYINEKIYRISYGP